MPAARRLLATLVAAEPVRSNGIVGVRLGFRPERVRWLEDRVEHFADLDPELTASSVSGLAAVVRVLRAARLAPPADSTALAGRAEEAAARLERALGTRVQLEVRPRTRLRFVVWTDDGVLAVDDVADVTEGGDAWLVRRRGGRLPLRIPRESVTRRQTEAERWWEVVGIERASEGSRASPAGA